MKRSTRYIIEIEEEGNNRTVYVSHDPHEHSGPRPTPLGGYGDSTGTLPMTQLLDEASANLKRDFMQRVHSA